MRGERLSLRVQRGNFTAFPWAFSPRTCSVGKAGIHPGSGSATARWTPACAGDARILWVSALWRVGVGIVGPSEEVAAAGLVCPIFPGAPSLGRIGAVAP